MKIIKKLNKKKQYREQENEQVEERDERKRVKKRKENKTFHHLIQTGKRLTTTLSVSSSSSFSSILV